DPGYPERPTQVWTQGQAEDSAYYFPCFDFPGEKFTTEMLATVPATWFALSNGRLVEVTENGRSRTKTYHWAQEVAHPAYLVTLAIADFIFGGMENASATTMTDTLLHDERAHEDVADQCDSISAHELAHQWFGDLLTCREWSHGWLNESFATYFDALFVEEHR